MDELILELLQEGRLEVNPETGEVFALRSMTPAKPVGSFDRKGYLRTSLYKNRKTYTALVHRIATIAYFGLPPHDNSHVNHKNGIKADNRKCNLEWATPRENYLHAVTNGLTKAVPGPDNQGIPILIDINRRRRQPKEGGKP